MASTVVDVVDEHHAPGGHFFTHRHYVDLGPISRGAFGDVRCVHDTRSSRRLAMKIMRRCIGRESRSRVRFATEIEIMTSLRHRGILSAEEHGEFEDGRLWFTMPEIRGRTFAVVLDQLHAPNTLDGFHSPRHRRVLRSFANLCLIVDFAHEQGFVHRDLKPKNMMVADDEETFVLDWGLAKRMPRTFCVNALFPILFTEPGEVLGTPAYMPPEQAYGDISLQSSASDIYSLGAVLYHLLTGQPPYRGTPAAVLKQVMRNAPPPISAIVGRQRMPPKDLVNLCEAAMQRAPAKRIARARHLAQEILKWLDDAKSPDS